MPRSRSRPAAWRTKPPAADTYAQRPGLRGVELDLDVAQLAARDRVGVDDQPRLLDVQVVERQLEPRRSCVRRARRAASGRFAIAPSRTFSQMVACSIVIACRSTLPRRSAHHDGRMRSMVGAARSGRAAGASSAMPRATIDEPRWCRGRPRRCRAISPSSRRSAAATSRPAYSRAIRVRLERGRADRRATRTAGRARPATCSQPPAPLLACTAPPSSKTSTATLSRRSSRRRFAA